MNYDENAICKAYGKRMMLMPIPFILGGIIDIQYQGITKTLTGNGKVFTGGKSSFCEA